MNSKLPRASTFAAAVTMIATILSAGGSGAAAETPRLDAATVAKFNANFDQAIAAASEITTVSNPVVQPLPAADADAAETALASDEAPVSIDADSLAELVAHHASADDGLTAEQNCLAGAIYFEAKSESLEGQLAVGRVIVARSKSGRFPGSYCGVVYQPSQFSFVRGRSMPGINKGSRQWQNAAAMARIAHAGSWRSPVEGALFFHATHVSPGWRLKRMARIDNHVFYR